MERATAATLVAALSTLCCPLRCGHARPTDRQTGPTAAGPTGARADTPTYGRTDNRQQSLRIECQEARRHATDRQTHRPTGHRALLSTIDQLSHCANQQPVQRKSAHCAASKPTSTRGRPTDRPPASTINHPAVAARPISFNSKFRGKKNIQIIHSDTIAKCTQTLASRKHYSCYTS